MNHQQDEQICIDIYFVKRVTYFSFGHWNPGIQSLASLSLSLCLSSISYKCAIQSAYRALLVEISSSTSSNHNSSFNCVYVHHNKFLNMNL